MIFKIRNLGIVESADIEVNGLTVITGLNDTGKSFISKAIFAVIHTINNIEEEEKIKNTKAIEQLSEIYGWASEIIEISDDIESKLVPGLIQSDLEIVIKRNEAKYSYPIVVEKISRYQALILDYLNSKPSISSIQRKQECIKNINDSFDALLNTFSTKRINKERIKNKKAKKKGIIDTRFFKSFNDKINYYFSRQISTLEGKDLIIEVSEAEGSESNILEIVANNEQLTKQFDYNPPFNFKDITLIDTPVIIHLSRYINFTMYYQNDIKNEVPLHMPDLANKLIKSTTRHYEGEFSNLYEEISEIIGGRVEVDPKDANIAFWKYKLYEEKNLEPTEIIFQKSKDEKQRIASFNIATGIKSFGILQLLFNGNYINSRSILIIDEPEAHLHPQWILEYAKIIVSLSRANIKVIVSTHSDTLVSALDSYVKKFKLESTSKFYFGDKKGKTVKFEDVTDDLEPIYKQLVIAEVNMQMI